MKNDIIEIKKDVLMCMGESPANALFSALSANAFVVREGSDLFIIDTGAGSKMRKSIKEAVEKLRDGCKKLYLINTHVHVDHIANNEMVSEFEGFEEVHYLAHEAAEPSYDVVESTIALFRQVDKYYNFFEGPPPPWRFFTRMLGFGSHDKAIRKTVEMMIKNFEPIRPWEEKVEYFSQESSDAIEMGVQDVESLALDGEGVSIDLSPRSVDGWKIGNVIFINDRAHSPEHIIVLFAKKKLLITGDLTIELFPTWPGESSGERTVKHLKWVIEMACEGIVEIVADSHHNKFYRGTTEIKDFINRLIGSYEVLRDKVLEQFRDKNGLTVNEIYRNIRKLRFESSVIDHYLENQFPKTPIFLKTVIANILMEQGARVEGSGKKAKFYMPK